MRRLHRLDGVPDGSCGVCTGVYECAASREALLCVGDIVNACGECWDLGGTVGEPCGACDGTKQCNEWGNLECVEEPVNDCGGCTRWRVKSAAVRRLRHARLQR